MSRPFRREGGSWHLVPDVSHALMATAGGGGVVKAQPKTSAMEMALKSLPGFDPGLDLLTHVPPHTEWLLQALIAAGTSKI
ncbi:hypothetical protein VA599_04450 [Chromobacterium sp. TRC.1.1.SA]|uniref:Uncharacterized protein n=1 Tax=Chromobacterium indicum TaxID=3110228 RepID=A0ABV0CHU9_9NEIS